jgi:uncharacterized protein YndB with AHSA1/START domain
MAALKQTLEERPMDQPRHVYSVYVRSTPERLWNAIVDGSQTALYYYGTRVDSTWEAGASLTYRYPDGSVAADGSVLEIDSGRRVTMSFHARWDPEIEAEGPVRMIWEIEPAQDGVCQLTVTVLDASPGSKTATEFMGGLAYIVSGLKSLVETGQPLAA